jgi:hypothetical protein
VSTGKLSSAAVLRLPAGPLAAQPDRPLDEWALLCRLDGRRPLAALAGGSGLTEVVAVAERLLAAGLVEHVADAEVDDRPAEAGPALPAGDAGGFPEPASPVAGPDGPAGEEERIDSVSLLRELASESAAAPQPDEPGAEAAWEELASRLSGDQEQAAGGGQEQAAPPGGQPPSRPPGRDHAALMREFASLMTDDSEGPDAAKPPAPEADGEQPEDRSRGGRFGFRKGQRR